MTAVAFALEPEHFVRSIPVSAYVHPGHLYVGRDEGTCTTILGSCVAVCLHDEVARIGGLNHFLLPIPGDDAEPSPRYAQPAIDLLIQRMLQEGARHKRLVAQVVGGAAVLAAFSATENHLGRRNVTAARDLLAERRIPVIGADVGGTRGRKLVFEPGTGRIKVTKIGGH